MKRIGGPFRKTLGSKGASTKKVDFFRYQIQEWWKNNRRDFPWRVPTRPYNWLMAELMLRRTRASQVVPVYEAFMQKFPTPEDLSAADDGEVIEMLRPLGLAWRVPAFKQLASRIVMEHGGQVPSDRGALLALPGVGDYVAEAVRCFGFGEAVAIVDANTVRVSARYFGFEFDPESRRNKEVRAAVAQLLDATRPAESNLALLDFAATICQPLRPLCESCPVAPRCAWRQAVVSEGRLDPSRLGTTVKYSNPRGRRRESSAAQP
jgi:A/G-specific adenine glycosylase